MKKVNYVEYKHSVAHAIEPKMKSLRYNAFVAKKPVNYCFAIIKNAINSNDVRWTEKEQFIFDNFKAIDNPTQLYAYAKAVVNKALETEAYVDEDGELID